jgi:beta-glucosidase
MIRRLAAAAALAAAASPASALTPADILPQLTLGQKIGQMTQLNVDQILTDGAFDPAKGEVVFKQYGVGSIINTPDAGGCGGLNQAQWRSLMGEVQAYVLAAGNTTPPIPLLYGLDSVHGANYVLNATMFPHATGAAAAWDPDLVAQAAAIAALDTRASGIPWMFSPVLGLGMQPLWSRLYETFGESPHVGAAMATAYITGAMQGARARFPYNFTLCAPTAKHYLGYPLTRSGKDRTDAW